MHSDNFLKTCTKCSILKDREEFPKNARFKLEGLNSRCKTCCNVASKQWREENPDRFKARSKKNYQKHKIKNRSINRRYYEMHRSDKAAYDVIYRAKKRVEIAAYKKEWEKKRKDEAVFKIKRNLRRRIGHVLKGYLKADKTFTLVGCTAAEFKAHLESLFEPGMSWESYNYRGWHIDHIVPCYSFDLSDPEQQRLCFHYTNQRPLWAQDNLTRRRKDYSRPVANHSMKDVGEPL